MSLSGQLHEPLKIGPSVVDAFSGMTLAFGIASALFYREKNEKGQYLDVSLLSTAMNLLESNLIEYSITKKNPLRVSNHDNAISPFGAYKAKDAYIVVAAGNENIWKVFANFLKKHISFDETLFSSNVVRLKNNNALSEIIEKVFAKYSVSELEKIFSEISIPCSKVNEMSDVANDEENFRRKALVHISHSKLGECIVPGSCITFSECSIKSLKEAPEIGEDNKKYGI